MCKQYAYISVLRRFSTSLNTCRRRQVFNAFVKPHLTYCLPVWGNTSITDQNLFDKTLLRSSCLILNNPNINFNSQVFLSTDLCFFKYHLLISNVIAVFNVQHNECTNSLNSFVLLSDVHDRLIRSSNANKIKTKLVKRECDNKCFLYTSLKDWNALPNSVTMECNFNKFINGVKIFINSRLDS